MDEKGISKSRKHKQTPRSEELTWSPQDGAVLTAKVFGEGKKGALIRSSISFKSLNTHHK